MADPSRGILASLLLQICLAFAVYAKETQYIYGTSITGVTQKLAVDRTPALYTGDFGDCLGGHSLFNTTRFDAAYYQDNSTVLFHLDAQSSIANESLMMSISMSAYGQSRFQMTFDPCLINIYSLCPLNASVPVTAWATFAIGPKQLGDIPSLAFSIPDFEGSVRLQVFGNTSRTEIGCFQASLTNGITMAYPGIVSPFLVVFTLTAMIASFVTAAYGMDIPTMRTHYAHSLSVVIVIETFQTIFFSGALGLDWPSILVAWWSNFAWSAGQIYNNHVLGTIDPMSGNVRNTSQVGNAGSLVDSVKPYGSGLAQQIYRRLVGSPQDSTALLFRRQPYNASDPYDYTWAGDPVHSGVVLPGTWSGYGGTLAALNLPVADTFALGFIWLLVTIALIFVVIAIFKCTLEALRKTKRLKKNRFTYFRHYWGTYAMLAALRMLYAAFAMIMTLAMLQLSLGGSSGAKALAAIFFIVFLVGNGVLIVQASQVRLKGTYHSLQQDMLVLVPGTLFRFIPFIFPMRLSSFREPEELPQKPLLSLPFLRIQSLDNDPDRISVHQDDNYIKRFGWLSARYRRTKWWFFSYYSGYQFFRAIIIGGGSATPKPQVLCLLVYEVLAFLVAVMVDPFEGRRNTALAVWMLGVSKILTTALSIAFLPSLNLDRITATAIGVIIIAIQGLLAVAVLILIVLGAISSYLSLSRDKDSLDHKEFEAVRLHYFKHMEDKALDVEMSRVEKARLQRLKDAESIARPAQPSFTVLAVRRMSKIYDEDEETVVGSNSSLSRPKLGRSDSSLSTHNLPRAARSYRSSWSSLDLAEAECCVGEGEDEQKAVGEDDQDRSITVQALASRRRPEMTIKRHSAISASGIPFNATLESTEEEDAADNNPAQPSSDPKLKEVDLIPGKGQGQNLLHEMPSMSRKVAKQDEESNTSWNFEDKHKSSTAGDRGGDGIHDNIDGNVPLPSGQMGVESMVTVATVTDDDDPHSEQQ